MKKEIFFEKTWYVGSSQPMGGAPNMCSMNVAGRCLHTSVAGERPSCSRFTFLHVLLIYNLLDYQYLVKDELTTMGSRHSSSHGFGLIDVRQVAILSSAGVGCRTRGDRSGLSLLFAGTGVAGFYRSGALNLSLSRITIVVVSIRQ